MVNGCMQDSTNPLKSSTRQDLAELAPVEVLTVCELVIVIQFVVFIYSPADKKKGGQSGLISCIAMHPTQPGTFALGSYSCSGSLNATLILML